jgi:hypothetical protein
MASRKIKIEVSDNMGGNFSISYSGQVNREKVLQLLDFIDLLGGSNDNLSDTKEARSKFDRIIHILENHYPVGSFITSDIQRNYEDEFKEPINLSTVSTYIARLVNKKIVIHSGLGSKRTYKLNRSVLIEKMTKF